MMKKICSVMLLCATILMASCQKDDEATIGVSEVKLDKTELSLAVDASETLVATILPDNAEDATVAWSSSDKTVATVSEAGVVLAIKVGETTITATAGGKTATCKVTVTAKAIAVTSVTLNKTTTTIEKEKTEKLVPAIAPTNATDQTVTWSSDKETVATVAQDGTVTAVAAGEANITATSTSNTTVTATCKVTVEDKPNYVEVKGIKVATGNLVANGANSCKIGAPTDGGLYFQFGSLIGWAGGANGDGTGVPASDSPGYEFNATGTVVPSGKSIPATWGDSEKWTGGTTAAETVPAANDPCAHYLGSDWRLPTTDEYKTLFSNTTGAWIDSDGWTFNGTSKSSATHTSGLTFPASGYRYNGDGSLSNVGTYGYYWSASPSNASNGYALLLTSSYVSPSNSSNRALGLPVRCVQNASN